MTRFDSRGFNGIRLVGREPELAEADRHLRAACTGAGRMLVFEGPAGIGKSALLGALRPIAAACGAHWLGAGGSQLERDFPFGVVRQLLEATVAEADPRLLAGAAALAGTVLGSPDERAAPEPGFAVLHSVFRLVANLAERGPLVVCVDDVQWADAPSLRFLDHLATRLDGLPVLGVLAARSGDATLTAGPIARLTQHTDVHTLPVAPLDVDAVGTIVRDGLGPRASDDLVAACHEVTGGNPFLLREVVGELRRSGEAAATDIAVVRRLAPPAIVRALRLRLEALPEHATSLMRAIATLNGGCDLSAAAELAGLELEAAQDAADVLAGADLIAPERPLRFSHAVVGSAARESMPAAVRSDLHRRAAAMAAGRLDGSGLDAAAGHLLAVDPVGDHAAAAVLQRAAAVARRRGAADTASTYLRRALAEPPAPEHVAGILVDLAGAAAFAGEPDALVFAERALEVADDPLLRLRAAREIALVEIAAGRYEVAADTMARALDDAAAVLEAPQRLAAEGLLLVVASISATARQAHAARLKEALALAERLGDAAPGALLVLSAFDRVLVAGDPRGGLEVLDRALAGGRVLREATADSPLPYIAGNTLVVSGRYAQAEALLTEVIGDAAGRGSVRAYALATAQRGLCRLRRGRLHAAEADARASLEVRDGQTLVQRAVAVATVAGALTEQGDLGGAEEALALLPPGARRPETHTGVVLEDIRARLYAAGSRWHESLVACEACAAWEREFDVRHGGWTGWRGVAAQAHAALGDGDRAARLAHENLALARAYGVPRTLGLALRAAAAVAPEPGARSPLLREAADVLARGDVRAEAAKALHDLGAALAAEGGREEARSAYEQARTAAEAAGARALEQAARDGLIGLGARPRRRGASGYEALTPGERRVAELAARGTSNRDIAEQLFLTLKTVEHHLTATYRKLGISSRSQLADRLGEAWPHA